MRPNAFIGKAERPTDGELAAALGPAKSLWDQLVASLVDDFQLDGQEWSSYSLKAGWSLRLQRRKRNILYLIPCRGCFRAAFVLGDKALQVARQSKLPQPVVRMLAEAKRYPEGTAVRLDVAGPKDLEVILKLAKAKIEG
ncbi:MAG TPA: DUF3788 domain-containing protein [Bryobacteraceae bacterium]|nr:DUF3788 domain-containing protein [Bryobacteraceae bacterium]